MFIVLYASTIVPNDFAIFHDLDKTSHAGILFHKQSLL